jgi:hypothetical protein
MKILRCDLHAQPLTAVALAGNKEHNVQADTLRHLAVACYKLDKLSTADDAEADLVLTQKIQDMEADGEYEYRGADAAVPERLQKVRESLAVRS